MRALPILAAATLLLAACGQEPQTFRGQTYVMGSAVGARERAVHPRDEKRDDMTLGELAERAEAGQNVMLDFAIHMLLELGDDGLFTYYGPLKMGEDPSVVRGRWRVQGDAVELQIDPPRQTKDGVVAVLRCPLRDGILDYPMGSGSPQVYYRMTEATRVDGRTPVIRIGDAPSTTPGSSTGQ